MCLCHIRPNRRSSGDVAKPVRVHRRRTHLSASGKQNQEQRRASKPHGFLYCSLEFYVDGGLRKIVMGRIGCVENTTQPTGFSCVAKPITAAVSYWYIHMCTSGVIWETLTTAAAAVISMRARMHGNGNGPRLTSQTLTGDVARLAAILPCVSLPAACIVY